MTNSKLVETVGNKLVITFQSIINIESFEILLKQTYKSSLKEKFLKVDFLLKAVTWLEPFQLSQFSLWLLELKNLGKEIYIFYPTLPKVIDFLRKMHFVHFLKNENIATDYFNLHFTSSFKFNRNEPFLPLTFSDSSSFEELLLRLHDEDYFNVIFEEVKHFAITRKAVILDILIKELADNIEFHAAGYASNIILCRGDNSNLSYPKKYSVFEENFFKHLNIPYLEIILSDKGPGIGKTLLKSFNKNHKEKKGKKNNSDIIEYSTFESSSSRTKEQRLKDIQKKLSSDIEKIVPFTGLFQIREIVKTYNGLLIIRSGDSMVAFNTTKDGLEEIIKSSQSTSYKSLINFGGTQIRILIPVINEKSYSPNNRIPFNYKEVAKKLTYKYISLFDYFKSSIKDDNFSNLAESFSNVLDDIQTANNSGKYTSVVVDCKSSVLLDSKLIFLMVCQLMVYQKRYNIVYTLINLNQSITEIINDALKNKSDIPKAPIVVFNENYTRSSIGFSHSEKEIYEFILQVKEFQLDTHTKFAFHYPHLFYLIEETGGFELRHNRREIIELKKGELEKRLSDFIKNINNGIYYDNLKVLSSSGKYSATYYEVYALLISKREKYLVTEWVLAQLLLHKPEAIISVGQHTYSTIDSCLNVMNKKKLLDNHYSITFTALESRLRSIDMYCTGKKIIIFTDVIASGKTLQKILEGLISVKEVIILCVVNLTTSNIIQGVTIFPIIHDPIQLYDSLPNGWNYEELHTIDKKTNQILPKPSIGYEITNRKDVSKSFLDLGIKKRAFQTKNDVIDIYVNDFLEQIVIPNKAYYIQVYNKAGYMPIMYDINVIINLLKDQFAQDIVDEVFRLENFYGSKIVSLIHLEYHNNPFKSLINSLLITYPSLDIIALSPNHLEIVWEGDDSFLGSGVMILDDAFTTGDALFKLIEYCEKRGAKFIFCYVLIKRSSVSDANKLLKLRKYGNSEIYFKYCFDAQLPVYKVNNNPIIKSSNEISKLIALFQIHDFSKFLKEINNKNSYRNSYDTSIFSSQDSVSEIVVLRWQLELAKDYLVFRKELSLLFDDVNHNVKKILLLFRILEHEREVFLNDVSLKEHLFYSVFKEKIIKAILLLLDEYYVSLDAPSIYDIYTSFIAIDSEVFFEYLLNLSKDKIVDEKCFYPLITVLSVYQRNIYDMRRYIYLGSIEDGLLPTNLFDAKILIGAVRKFWESEAVDMYSQNNSKKAFYVKALLKSSFHDFLKILNYLRTSETETSTVVESWYRISKMCKNANYNLSGLFSGNLYPSIEAEFYPFLKDLSSNTKVGDNIAEKLRIEQSNSAKEKLQYDIVEVIKNIEQIVFNNGLLEKVSYNFRIEIKQFLANAIEKLKIKFSVNKAIILGACNVFCSSIDFVLILENICENVIEHSGASNILIKVFKLTEKEAKMIIVQICDDGQKIGEITYGDGLTTCQTLIEKYSGKIRIFSLNTVDNQNTDYSTCVELKFHDLSKEILNLPTYATETTADH